MFHLGGMGEGVSGLQLSSAQGGPVAICLVTITVASRLQVGEHVVLPSPEIEALSDTPRFVPDNGSQWGRG